MRHRLRVAVAGVPEIVRASFPASQLQQKIVVAFGASVPEKAPWVAPWPCQDEPLNNFYRNQCVSERKRGYHQSFIRKPIAGVLNVLKQMADLGDGG